LGILPKRIRAPFKDSPTMPSTWSTTADEIGTALQTILPDHFILMIPGGIGEARRVEVLRSPSVLFGPVAVDGTTTGSGHGGPVRRWNITIIDGEVQSPSARRERLLDAAAAARDALPALLADMGIVAVAHRERLLSSASIASGWEMELLEFLTDPALLPPVLGTGLETLGVLGDTWDHDATEGTLDTGGTPPAPGDVLVLEAGGGSPRLSLGRVVDVEGLQIETDHAPGETFAAGSLVHRVENSLFFPCLPAPMGPGPSSRRSGEADMPLAAAFSARIGAGGAWERRIRLAPLPLLMARNMAEGAATIGEHEDPFVFIDEWRRVLDGELAQPPEWESLGDGWGAAAMVLANPTT